MKNIAFIFILFFLITSCSENQRKQEYLRAEFEKSDSITVEENAVVPYVASLSLDTAVEKQDINFTFLLTDTKADTLFSFCNCEKNVKNNTLKIQLRTSLPPQSLLEKGAKPNPLPGLIPQDSLQIQYRFLTFHLQYSIMEKAELLKVSTENQFNGQNKEQVPIHQYKITINRFNYKIASDVWGEYEVVLPSGFGYLENDTLVRGTFQCNNWKIVQYDELDDYIEPGRCYMP